MAEDENENEEELTNGDAGGDVSRDLDTDEHIKDPIEDRRTLAERNERLHDQLKVRTYIYIRFSLTLSLVHFDFNAVSVSF